MSALFPPLSEESRRLTGLLPALIDAAFPLPGRFRAALPRDTAELSRLLTSGRTERNNSYLGQPAMLSAYLRYFLPWNIYRLSRFLSSLPLDLKPGDAVNDFGAGPLTFAAALWISRPDLRSAALEFRCIDRTSAVLEAGKKFFAALAAETETEIITQNRAPSRPLSSVCPWKLKTIRGEIRRNGTLSAEIKGKPAALSAAVNVYNELFWGFSPADTAGLRTFAGQQARLLSGLTESSGSVLVMEPGIPRSGEFISLLRSCLIDEGRPPLAPCVHRNPCPLPGGRAAGKQAKWCHFVFDTEDAPEELLRLSAAAMIPKERAALSFIFSGCVSPREAERKTAGAKQERSAPRKIRVISDSFPLDGGKDGKAGEKKVRGRYGCCEEGLVLVRGNGAEIEASASGALEELPLTGLKDAKSGALTAEKSTTPP